MSIKKLIKYIFSTLFLLSIASTLLIYTKRDEIIAYLKPELESKLSQLLKARVEIETINGKLWPGQGLTATGIKLYTGNACQAGIAADRINLLLDLRSLLAKKIIIDTIEAENAVVNLRKLDARLELGVRQSLNQECSDSISLPPNESLKSGSPGSSAETPVSRTESLIALDIHKIALLNATISVQTESGKNVEFKNVNLASELNFENNNFVLNNSTLELTNTDRKFEVSSQKIEFNNQDLSLKISSARLISDNNQLDFEVGFSDGFKLDYLSLDSKSLKIPIFAKLSEQLGLATLPFSGQSLQISGKLKSVSSNSYQISADIGIQDLSIPAMDIRLDLLRLQKLEGVITSGKLNSMQTRLMLQGGAIAGHQHRYEVASAEGPLHYSSKKMASQFDSQLNVKNFMFSDGNTTVSKCSALIKDLRIISSFDGSLEASGVFQDGQTLLLNPAIEVLNANNISGPVKVVVRKDFYEVRAHAKVGQSKIRTYGRIFDNLSGESAVLVSKNLKKFSSGNISAYVDGEPVGLSATFAITPNSYNFTDTVIKAAGGTSNVLLDIGRQGLHAFKAKIDARGHSFPGILKLLAPNSDISAAGTIESFQLAGSGNLTEIPQSIKAQGAVRFVKNNQSGIDLSSKIAYAVAQIPFVSGKLDPAIVTKDTNLQIAQATFQIKNGRIASNDINIQRENWTVKGKAELDFEGNLDGKVSVDFLEDRISKLAPGFSSLGKLLGRVGRISIPLFMRGKLPDISFAPDLATLTKDNSGITLLSETGGAIGEVGAGIADVISSPFRKRKKN